MSILTNKDLEVLKKARETYGNKKQIAIAAEECCELSQALLKLFRYDNEEEAINSTRAKVLEERADVEIMLDHVDNVYGFAPYEIQFAALAKISRLKGWLEHSDKSEYTMQAREIPIKTDSCEGCFYYDHFDDPDRENACRHCPKAKE